MTLELPPNPLGSIKTEINSLNMLHKIFSQAFSKELS